MRPIRVLRSATFRLALISASLSTLSAIVLFAVIYWAMTGYATSQFEAGIVSDAKALVEVARSDGLGGLTEEVDRRTHAKQTPAAYYLLLGNDGHVLAGNLPPLAPRAGWHRLHGSEHPRQDRDADEPTILAYGIALPGGGFVLVGRDAHLLEELRELIVRAFAWAGGVTVMLAIGSGLLVSTGFLRRVEAINRTTQEIIDGDLKRRVPTRDTGDEIDHLAGNLNRMLDRIGALMEGLRQVSNDIAHDLRTPLARIRQRLDDLRLNAGSLAEYEAVVDRTMGDVDVILGAFNALLRIAQIESGTRRAGFADVDLSAIFQNVVDAYAPVAEQDGQTLTANIQAAVTVRGDDALLTQMLSNLVENALRHTPLDTAIDVRLEDTQDGVVATVTDTGPGIPEEARDKVLQRFYRLDASRTTAGSGLGLSLVAAVTELHGIAITLTDNAPGLKVILKFPAVVTRNRISSG